MKFAKFVLSLALLASVSARAQQYAIPECRTGNEVINVMTDVIFVRPAGLVGTLAGGALFVGLAPLSALASIAPPHDAFPKVGVILVGIPYSYTFERPVGSFCY